VVVLKAYPNARAPPPQPPASHAPTPLTHTLTCAPLAMSASSLLAVAVRTPSVLRTITHSFLMAAMVWRSALRKATSGGLVSGAGADGLLGR
jgi:hypothetical protein